MNDALRKGLLFLESAMLGGVLLLLTCIVFWAADKGIDLTDECYYLMGYRLPNQLGGVVTCFQVVVAHLLFPMAPNVVGLRLMRLFLQLSSSVFMAYGLYQLLKTTHRNGMPGLHILPFTFFVCIGSFLNYAWAPQTLSYNSLTFVVMQLITGLVSYIWLIKKNQDYRANVSFFALGLFIAILILVKPTSGLFTFMILFLLVLLKRKSYADVRNTIGLTGRLLIFFVSGVLVSLILVFKSWTGFLHGIEQLKLGYQLNTGYRVFDLFKNYLDDVHQLLRDTLMPSAFFLVVPLAFLFVKSPARLWIWRFLILFIILYLVWNTWVNQHYLGASVTIIYPYFTLFVFLFLSFFCFDTGVLQVRRMQSVFLHPHAVLCALLFLLPLIGSFGTTNNLAIAVVCHSSFLFAGLYILILNLNTALFTPVFKTLLIIGLCVLAFSQTGSGLVQYPYRLNGDLFKQKNTLKIAQDQVLKVDSATCNLVDSLNLVLNRQTLFKPGDKIFTTSEQFGLVYLVGGVVPGLCFYPRTFSPASCNLLSSNLCEADSSMLLLVDSLQEMNSDFEACLQNSGVNFPKNYVKSGSFYYRLPWTSEVKTLSLFVPRSMIKP